jgi:hypothetical protein
VVEVVEELVIVKTGGLRLVKQGDLVAQLMVGMEEMVGRRVAMVLLGVFAVVVAVVVGI